MPRRRASKETPRSLQDQVRVLNRNMEKMNQTLLSLLERLKKGSVSIHVNEGVGKVEHLDADGLLSLPDHLRKTAMAISKLAEGTATLVSRETGRVRAAESDYLNQLVSMGYLRKRRVGRDIVFSVEK